MAPVFFGGPSGESLSRSRYPWLTSASAGGSASRSSALRSACGSSLCSWSLTLPRYAVRSRLQLVGEVRKICCSEIEFAVVDALSRPIGTELQRPVDVGRHQPRLASRTQIAGMGGDEHQLARCHTEQVGASEIRLWIRLVVVEQF